VRDFQFQHLIKFWQWSGWRWRGGCRNYTKGILPLRDRSSETNFVDNSGSCRRVLM